MTWWQLALTNTLSISAIAGIISIALTYFIKHISTKNLEKYKFELNSKFKKELEEMKYLLNKELQDHNISYLRIYEKKIEIFHKIYMYLYEVKESASQLVNIFEYGNEPTKSERLETFSEKYNLFIKFFKKNRLFLDQNISTKIDKLARSISDKISDFNIDVIEKEKDGTIGIEGRRSWNESVKFIQKQVPKIFTEIEIDFQRILKIIENS